MWGIFGDSEAAVLAGLRAAGCGLRDQAKGRRQRAEETGCRWTSRHRSR